MKIDQKNADDIEAGRSRPTERVLASLMSANDARLFDKRQSTSNDSDLAKVADSSKPN